jgi:hypothetical protein
MRGTTSESVMGEHFKTSEYINSYSRLNCSIPLLQSVLPSLAYPKSYN